MSPVADPLSLQGLEIELETPAAVYHSRNSVYACVPTSALSRAC